MNINELITTYCPNGVKYVTLGEIATEIYRGSGIKKIKSQMQEYRV